MIAGIPIINFGCFVLCLISFIVINIAALPPTAESNRSVFSGTRQPPRFEESLSCMQTAAETTLIKIR